MGQKNHLQVRIFTLYFPSQHEGIHIGQMQHGNNQIKIFFIQCRQGFSGCGHPCKAGRVAEIQAAVFMNDSLGKAAVFLHDPGIIRGRNQQDIPDFSGHQLVENFKMRIKILGKDFNF